MGLYKKTRKLFNYKRKGCNQVEHFPQLEELSLLHRNEPKTTYSLKMNCKAHKKNTNYKFNVPCVTPGKAGNQETIMTTMENYRVYMFSHFDTPSL